MTFISTYVFITTNFKRLKFIFVLIIDIILLDTMIPHVCMLNILCMVVDSMQEEGDNNGTNKCLINEMVFRANIVFHLNIVNDVNLFLFVFCECYLVKWKQNTNFSFHSRQVETDCRISSRKHFNCNNSSLQWCLLSCICNIFVNKVMKFR